MRNLKYFMLAFALMFSIGIYNVNAEVGKTPGSITTKEDLIYYIYYYGGSAKIVDDKVVLTSSLELSVPLNFTSAEAITIDLNGNHLYFDNNVSSTAINIYSVSKNVTITDSSKTDNDYIRAQSATVIYNSSSSSALTIENTKVVSNSDSKVSISAYGVNTNNIINTIVQSEFKGITAQAGSKFNIKNSTIKFGNMTGDCAICVTGTNANVVVNNSNVSMSDYATEGKAVYVNVDTANVTINSGTFKSYNTAVNVDAGNVIINGGSFVSTNSYALDVLAGKTVINGGEFTSNSISGVKIESGADVTLKTSKIKAGNSSVYGALLMPKTSSLASYIGADYFVNDSSTTTGTDYIYTTAKEINVIAKPKTAVLSATKYVYNGYRKTPTVIVKDADGKKLVNGTDYKVTYQSGRVYVGKYYVKVTYINKYADYGTKKLYFVINPRSTSIYKLTPGDNKFTVTINKRTTQTTGYQVMYSTSSKFSSYKTYKIKNTYNKVTLKGLNKKKYYVKVRTYKVVNGVTYYSSWSSVKTVTTK